ncbi:MAG: peroxiredoxin family protein [Rhodothermales bacterium]
MATVSEATIKAQKDTAWAQVKRHWSNDQRAKADSVQRVYADQFYQYYRAHPDTETGKDVLETAFAMWGNTGAADKVDEVLAHIDRDSDVWAGIVIGIMNAYASAARESEDDPERARKKARQKWLPLLEELNKDLSDPISRSMVLRQLGEHYQREGDVTRAQSLFEDMLSLQADTFHVEYAEGALYEIESLRVGLPAPDFTAETIEGDTVKLSDLKGEVVLLEFWATWCGPCLPDIPHLKKLHEKYGDQNFQLVGVSLDYELSELEQFVDSLDMAWPQVWQEKAWEGPVAELYNVTGIPDSYLIDQDGKIVAKDIDAEKLDEAVGELLAAPQE